MAKQNLSTWRLLPRVPAHVAGPPIVEDSEAWPWLLESGKLWVNDGWKSLFSLILKLGVLMNDKEGGERASTVPFFLRLLRNHFYSWPTNKIRKTPIPSIACFRRKELARAGTLLGTDYA